LSFSDHPLQLEELSDLSRRNWKALVHWLDIGGLALYFFDRLSELGSLNALPRFVAESLKQKMDENTVRTRGMMDESIAIQREFQKAGLRYAVMKGLSLSPLSVSRPELRHQFDLDYLIAEKSGNEARAILERRGYRLHAISGKTLEFKINETPYVAMKDLYKDLSYRAVELHLEGENAGEDTRLDRIERREFSNLSMPVFSPVDLFLSQGLHAFKDVCSSFSRVAHLLEFYRHVLARRDDDGFWCAVRAAAEDDRRASLGIGVVLELIILVMGRFAPESLTAWTVDVLPPALRLWVYRYGRRMMYGSHPGTKLYLLLEVELEKAGVPGRRPLKRQLVPLRLPPVVIRASSNEMLSTRIARYRVQSQFLFSRMCFHILEGLGFAIESYRWRRCLDRLTS